MRIKKTDLAYTAALVDGEGSIIIGRRGYGCKTKRKRVNYHLEVKITNNDLSLLKDCISIFRRGNINQKSKRSNKGERKFKTYVWHLHGSTAMDILKKILPFLKSKKEKALLGIKFQETLLLNNRRKPISRRNFRLRETMYLKMKSLKNSRMIRNLVK